MKHTVSNHRSHSKASRPRLFKLAALSLVPALVGVALWISPDRAEQSFPVSEAETKSVSSHRTSRGASRGTEFSYTWKAGDLLTYAVTSRTTVHLEDSHWDLSAPGNSTEISGQCSYRVLRVEADRVVLAAQMSHAHVRGDGRAQEHLQDLLESAPVILIQDRRGRRLDCLLPPGLPAEDREILAGMHEHQLILPEQRGSRTWDTEEPGRAGSLHCAHTVTRNGTIEKARRSVTRANPGTTPGCVIERSDITAKLGAPWIEILDVREVFAIHAASERIGSVESSFRMHLQPQTTEPSALASLADDPTLAETFTPLPSTPNSSPNGDSAMGRQNHEALREKYERIPLAQILEALGQAIENATEHADTLPAIYALRDWLLVNPDQAPELVESLRDPNLSEKLTARAIHALELASSKRQAQEALASILMRPDEFPRASLYQAVIAAGGVGEALIPQLHAALSETINLGTSTGDFSLSDAALYALGALAQTNPEVASQLEEALLSDLAAPNHERTTQTALNALANGRVQSPAIVQQANALAHNHPGEGVRAAAVRYLSRLPESTPAEIAPFLRDASDQVQLETVEALAVQLPDHPEALAPLQDHLAASPPDSVASRLREILGQ